MTNQLKTKLVRGAGWNALQGWGRRIFGFLVFPILAHMLGPENYGLIAKAGIYIAFLNIFADQTFTTVIEQKKELDPLHLDSLFWGFAVLSILLTVGTFFLAPTIASFFHDPRLINIIRALSPGYVLLIGRGLHSSLLRRELIIRPLAVSDLSAVLGSGVIGIGMAFSGFGVWSLVGQQLSEKLISVAIIWKVSPWRPSKKFSWPHLKELLPFGTSILGHRFLEVFSQQFGRLLITRTMGNVPLGYYSVTDRFMNQIVGMVVGANSMTLMPALASIKEDLPKFRHLLFQACRYTALIAFPLLFGMSITAEDFTYVVLGSEWIEAAPLLRILSMSGVVIVIQYMEHAALLAIGRPDLRLYLNFANICFNVIGFLLVVKHGILAIAVVFTVRAWLLFPLEGIVLKHFDAFRWKDFLASIKAPILASLGMSAGVWYIRNHFMLESSCLMRLGISIFCGGIIYLGLVLLIEPKFLTDILGLLKHFKSRNHSCPKQI